MRTVRSRRRHPVRVALAVVLVVLVVTAGGAAGIGWYYSDQLLDPAKARPGFPALGLDFQVEERPRGSEAHPANVCAPCPSPRSISNAGKPMTLGDQR